MDIFGNNLRNDPATLREHWEAQDQVAKIWQTNLVLMNQLDELTRRVEGAECLIDAVIEGRVRLGKKAKDFFGEYRFAFPKESSTSGPSPQTQEPTPAQRGHQDNDINQ